MFVCLLLFVCLFVLFYFLIGDLPVISIDDGEEKAVRGEAGDIRRAANPTATTSVSAQKQSQKQQSFIGIKREGVAVVSSETLPNGRTQTVGQRDEREEERNSGEGFPFFPLLFSIFFLCFLLFKRFHLFTVFYLFS